MDEQFKKELVKIIEDGESYSTIFLSKTQPVDSIEDEEMREFLERMYSSRDPAFNRLASVVNSVITQEQPTFMLSAREAGKLILSDKNSKYSSVDSKTYRAMVAKMLVGTKMFEKIRSPIGAKAAVFDLISPAILNVLYYNHGKEFFEAKKKIVLKIYDSKPEPSNISKEEAPKPELSFEEYMAKKEADESESLGDKLIESANEALQHAKGEIKLRTTHAELKESPKKNLWNDK